MVGDGLADVRVEELVGLLVEGLEEELELEDSGPDDDVGEPLGGLELELDVCGPVAIDEDVLSFVLCIVSQ
jgi:hypothetical protein